MPKCLVEELGTERERTLLEIDVSQDEIIRQIDEYGFDEREVIDIAYSSARWLYLHLRMYKDLSEETLSIDGSSFVVKDVDCNLHEYSLVECIDRVLEYLLEYLRYSNIESVVENYTESEEYCIKRKLGKAFEIYGVIVSYLWW